MPENKISLEPPTNEVRRSGVVVGITDRIYSISNEPTVTFDEILVKGDLSGELEYNGRKLEIVRVDTIIGLEVGGQGVRGPVWKGVECQVLA